MPSINWGSSGRSRSRRSASRPGWMGKIALLVSLGNLLMRIYRSFKGKGTSTRSGDGRSAPPGSAPPKAGSGKSAREWKPDDGPSNSATNAPPMPRRSGGVAPDAPSAPVAAGSDGGIGTLFKQQKSEVQVQASGEVVHILPDDDYDLDGSGRHQNFLVELMGGLTVKIAHNLAFGRAPINKGDFVSFRGEYIYNEKGGVVHWTHHDPKGWHEDGWIEHNGTRYG